MSSSDSDFEGRVSLMDDVSDDDDLALMDAGDLPGSNLGSPGGKKRSVRFAPGTLSGMTASSSSNRGCFGLRPPASTRAGYFALIFVPCICILIILAFVTANMPAEPDPPVQEPGLSPRPAAGSGEAAREALFQQSIVPDDIKKHLEELTRLPHMAGTPRDQVLSQYVMQQIRDLGHWETSIVEHPVLLTRPNSQSLVARGRLDSFASAGTPGEFTATLREDGGTGPDLGAEPPFNGYSGSGDLKNSCVVYVNFGRLEDFDKLRQEGVNITGCVGIARYGKIFRGNKARLCEENGCTGLLIYSDPADEGCRKGEVTPLGPWRNSSSAQRGSVWTGDGDPQTPGWPSTPVAPRLSLEDAYKPELTGNDPLPGIPVMPLAWRDAIPLVYGLCGQKSGGPAPRPVPTEWVGGLPDRLGLPGECDATTPTLSYCYGGRDADLTVDFKVDTAFEKKSIWNVMAVMRGHSERAVVVGNHRDGWTFGAVDPSSGTSVMLATAAALSKVATANPGWKPQRTIILASWDAEEYGLVGSYEWGEQFTAFAGTKVLAYLNVDIGVEGTAGFVGGGTPNFRELVIESARDVNIPALNDVSSKPMTAYESWLAAAQEMNGGQAVQEAPFHPVGSGSDFLFFLQRLGVSTIDMRFRAAHESYPVYHSNYDTFAYVEKFLDPEWERHAAVARVLGLTLLRLVDNKVLPFNWEDCAAKLTEAIDETVAYASTKGPSWAQFDASPLRTAVTHLQTAATAIRTELVAVQGKASEAARLADLNDRLYLAERAFLRDQGLPGRPLIRHSAWAPSAVDSYAGTAFSSITDAILANDTAAAAFEVSLSAVNVHAAAQVLQGWDFANL